MTQDEKNLKLYELLGKEPGWIGTYNPATDKVEYNVLHPNSLRTGVRGGVNK